VWSPLRYIFNENRELEVVVVVDYSNVCYTYY